MTIGIVGALAVVLVVAGVVGFRRLRGATTLESGLGRVSQNWLMERRADGQRDRFT